MCHVLAMKRVFSKDLGPVNLLCENPVFTSCNYKTFCWTLLKGTFQKLLSGFFPLRGSPSYPLNGKSFCQKTLGRKGGTPPPSPP